MPRGCLASSQLCSWQVTGSWWHPIPPRTGGSPLCFLGVSADVSVHPMGALSCPPRAMIPGAFEWHAQCPGDVCAMFFFLAFLGVADHQGLNQDTGTSRSPSGSV